MTKNGLPYAQRYAMKALLASHVLLRQWLQDPHAITVAVFAISCLFLGVASWLIQRNLRHNEPGLRAPLALPIALLGAAAGVFGTDRLPAPLGLIVGPLIAPPPLHGTPVAGWQAGSRRGGILSAVLLTQMSRRLPSQEVTERVVEWIRGSPWHKS